MLSSVVNRLHACSTPVGLAQSSLIVGDPLEARPPKAKHIVFLTIGSRGDVQPFIAFGRHLLQFGHTVTIATHAVRLGRRRDLLLTRL